MWLTSMHPARPGSAAGPACRWIAECVAQDQKSRVQDGIVFTF